MKLQISDRGLNNEILASTSDTRPNSQATDFYIQTFRTPRVHTGHGAVVEAKASISHGAVMNVETLLPE